MLSYLGSQIERLGRWLATIGATKSAPMSLRTPAWRGSNYTDKYKRNREPTPNELIEELKGVAWACASINASVCANFPPTLYVRTPKGQPQPKCLTKAISRRKQERFQDQFKAFDRIEEVVNHPLVSLLAMPTPPEVSLNSYDLWELTTLYLEVHGRAYWLLERDGLGTPRWAWILPAQNMTGHRKPNSENIIDYWEYNTGKTRQQFAPEDVLFFRYPDPRDPYLGGLSPLRSCFEQVTLTSHYAARKQAIFENDAIPSALISPEEVIGEEERERLETLWNDRLRRGGAGRVVVAESKMSVGILQHSLGDLALLAEQNISKEQIANAFHVPMPFLTTTTNLANLQAATHQHMSLCISPRLKRRDEKLNESLVPLFDDSGKLFLSSDDPIPINAENNLQLEQSRLKFGVVTINEVRGEQGLDPVPWGDAPWLPLAWARATDTERHQEAPATGRNKPLRPEEE
jgi:HK97 family phage portal protein